MKRKTGNEFRDENIMNAIQNILRKRSAASLELAREHILNMKIETSVAHQAVAAYARDWDDITHPGILSLACEAVGGNAEQAVPLQVVMLLLTAAADLHDDVIDQSRIKNGRPTVFGQFGKDIAILIGDAFFLEGFSVLIRNEKRIPLETLREVIDAIEEAYFEVGNAHLLEASQKGKTDLSPERYLEILRRKAWNIGVHARIGAILGGGTPDEIRALGEGGRMIGVLITLREEFIDIFEPKELQNRFRNECLPLPLLYAFEDPDVKKKILDILLKQRISKREVSEILRLLVNAGVVDKFRKRMKALSIETIESVSCIRNRRAKYEMNLLASATLEDI
jgi:geranylgeranyl pyrophosphate synthase